jgi:hypothetical protein
MGDFPILYERPGKFSHLYALYTLRFLLMLNSNVLKNVKVLVWQDFTSLPDLYERPFSDLYGRLFILYERPHNLSYESVLSNLSVNLSYLQPTISPGWVDKGEEVFRERSSCMRVAPLYPKTLKQVEIEFPGH